MEIVKKRNSEDIILDIMQVILNNQGILKSRLLSKANLGDITSMKNYMKNHIEKGFIKVELIPNKKKSFNREYYYLTELGIREYYSLTHSAV